VLNLTSSSRTSFGMKSSEDLERQLRSETQLASATNGPDVLLPQRFVSLVRGTTHVWNSGVSRECKVEILAKNAPGIEGPVAVFGCRARGWFDAREVALLNTGKRVLVWKREGKQAQIDIDGRTVGKIELGWCLRHAYIGSGCVWFGGQLFCRIRLPVLGPSSPQPRDCTGMVTFESDLKSIKFVINPNDADSSRVTMGAALWSKLRGVPAAIPDSKCERSKTIFYPSDQTRLAQLSDEQRLTLLALAVWPWALYKGGGT